MKSAITIATDKTPDLNNFIPVFMAADADRRRKALAVLSGEDDPTNKDKSEKNQPTDWLNQKQLAQRLGIDAVTVRRWKIPCKRLGRVPRYDWQEVTAYLDSEEFKQNYRRLQKVRSAQ